MHLAVVTVSAAVRLVSLAATSSSVAQFSNGSWVKTPLLLDTGADRTVVSPDILKALRLQPVIAANRPGGVEGAVSAITVETRLRLTRENNGKVIFRSQYAAITEGRPWT